jgi:endonuclease/exonuclease/phosphatase family metal-dependent hydrolase
MTSISNEISSEWSWADREMQVKAPLIRLASWMTEPVCKVHEYFRTIQVVDHLAHQIFLGLGMLFWGSLCCLAPLGIGLRWIVSQIETKPYLYFQGKALEVVKNDFSLLSWNIACNSGGYSISDAGVMPWAYRIDDIVKQLHAQDADVLSLYEVFDPEAGLYLYSQLKDQYAHFYFNIGARVIGVNSGIFIASKIAIENPEFIAFPKEMLVGRTKSAEKGFFSFDVADFKIFSTHLQHSEECDYSTSEEVEARKSEMELIMDKIRLVSGPIILTGDLNMGDEELTTWSSHFKKGEHSEKTWGGDQFYATLVGNKQISPAMNLDYTMVQRAEITTEIIPTGYDATIFNPSALSDHAGLMSYVTKKV